MLIEPNIEPPTQEEYYLYESILELNFYFGNKFSISKLILSVKPFIIKLPFNNVLPPEITKALEISY